MLNFRPILEIVGILIILLSSLMLIPAYVDYYYHDLDWRSFIIASFTGIFIGILLYLGNKGYKENISNRQAFLLTSILWIVLPGFSAIPFMLSTINLSITDAFFEAISGISSCGATIIINPDITPKGILIWRALLNWVGGIGIVVIAMSVLPMLKTGGMQLFKTESSDKSEKIFPRATQIAGAIVTIYLLMTIISVLALKISGLNFFDAICHAFTAISNGGFSNYSNSVALFNNAKAEIIIIIIMILSSLPFVIYIHLAKGNLKPLLNDSQVRCFFIVLLISILAIAIWLIVKKNFEPIEAIRQSAFNTTSIMTTAGLSIGNFNDWGTFPNFLFIVLSLIGGCTGSTSGAIKIMRFQILFSAIKVSIKQAIHPHGIFKTYYNGHVIGENIVNSIILFIIIYLCSFIFFALLLSISGLDMLSSISASASALAGAGYGLGDLISSSYHNIDDFSKWTLAIAMVLGRLEFFTVLVLFSPSFWRN